MQFRSPDSFPILMKSKKNSPLVASGASEPYFNYHQALALVREKYRDELLKLPNFPLVSKEKLSPRQRREVELTKEYGPELLGLGWIDYDTWRERYNRVLRSDRRGASVGSISKSTINSGTELEDRLTILEAFIDKQPSMMRLHRQSDEAMSSYRAQRRVGQVDTSAILTGIMRDAIRERLMTWDLLPILKERTDILEAMLRLGPDLVPQSRKKEIQAMLDENDIADPE